jgi:hypothetical protein
VAVAAIEMKNDEEHRGVADRAIPPPCWGHWPARIIALPSGLCCIGPGAAPARKTRVLQVKRLFWGRMLARIGIYLAITSE